MALKKEERKGVFIITLIKQKMKRIFLVDDDYDHSITFKVGLSLQNLKLMRILIQQSHYQNSSRITMIYC